MKGKRRSLLLPDFMHLSAATVMSAPTPIEAYDAQMLDFSSDLDVPMNITGSAEFFAETLMDHDGHLSTSSYGEHLSVEVDMEEYVGDNAEYEMADETTEFHRLHGDEPLDIEVYDASHAPSPLVPPHPLQPSVDVPIDSEHLASTSSAFSEHATLPELRTDAESEVQPAPPDHQVADTPHVEPSTSGEGISSEVVASESSHPVHAPDETIPPISEFHEPQGGTARTDEHLFEIPPPANAGKEVEPNISTVAEEHHVGSEVAQHENSEPPIAESGAPFPSAADPYESGPPVQDDKTAVQVPDPVVEKEAVDPLHISDGVYIDPPPVVLLSIPDLSEPGFTLFNQPHTEGEAMEQSRDGPKAYSLLFEDRPTLYYEPLSSVFEALRQDEVLLSRVPHSFEGELVLDAYDLHLAVSEDNVHSREISLHDLNILHDGSDFVGPLRLLLRSIVPRFIIRYYALQEQIQRLNIAVDVVEGEHDEVHHERYDAGEEQPQPQKEEAATVSTIHVAVPSEGLAKAEERTKEPLSPAEPTEEIQEESYEPDDTYGAQQPATEDEAAHVLEEEGDYESTNVGNEDESTKHDILDADQIHDTVAEDTDAPVTVTGQESKFEGEQTEYLDYIQQEEYDERYGEDLPERAGGALDVQYGEPVHYEGEGGEQDTSTAVDETQAILSGSDEGEDDKSADTPTPVRTVLEPESGEHVDDNATYESVSLEQEYLVAGSEELATSESTGGVVHAQASGNQDTNAAQTKVSSEVDESDSNFVSMLEREANAEFDRTFSTQHSGQEGSTEVALQHEETWDEWDDEDAEGDDEEGWIDPDAASNESSVTLSSKASSKRSFDEVDPNEEEVYTENPRSSPGSKRPRVQ